MPTRTIEGRTITSEQGLSSDEAELIYTYVSKFEWAKELNQNLRSGKKCDDGALIARAIQDKGLVATAPTMLYRRCGLHDPSWDPSTQPIASFKQDTIISTWTNKAGTSHWYGEYIYCIYLQAGERYISVEHTLIGGNAFEILLPPGRFVYNREYIKAYSHPRELLVVYHRAGSPVNESTFARANSLEGFKIVIEPVVTVRTISPWEREMERERERTRTLLAQADALVRLSLGSSGTRRSERPTSILMMMREEPPQPTWDQATSIPGYEWAPPSGGVIFDIRRSRS